MCYAHTVKVSQCNVSAATVGLSVKPDHSEATSHILQTFSAVVLVVFPIVFAQLPFCESKRYDEVTLRRIEFRKFHFRSLHYHSLVLGSQVQLQELRGCFHRF